MKLATTPEEQRRWMDQWRLAAVALKEMKRYELQTLTDEQALFKKLRQVELRRQFRQMDGEGSNESEPGSVLRTVRRVKKERRA